MFYDGESFVLEDRETLFKYLQRNSIGYKPYVLFTSLCPFGIQNLFVCLSVCLSFYLIEQVKFWQLLADVDLLYFHRRTATTFLFGKEVVWRKFTSLLFFRSKV